MESSTSTKQFVDVGVQTDICTCPCYCITEGEILLQESIKESSSEYEMSEIETDTEFFSVLEEADGSDPEYDEAVDVSQIPLPEHKERHFLIPQTILLALFEVCRILGCLSSATAKITSIVGTMVKITVKCLSGRKETWQGQRYHQHLPIGNQLASAGVVLSGSSIAKVSLMMHHLVLPFISKRTV